MGTILQRREYIYHAHNVRKHHYLGHHRRCEPCIQDEIKTGKKYTDCCLFLQTLSPRCFYSSTNMLGRWSQAWYLNRYYGQSTDVETERQWQPCREHGKRWKPNVSVPEFLLVLLHCQAFLVLFVSTRKYNMGCSANYWWVIQHYLNLGSVLHSWTTTLPKYRFSHLLNEYDNVYLPRLQTVLQIMYIILPA